MIKEEIYGYYIAVYKPREKLDLNNICKKEFIICLATPRTYIKSYRQLINTLYHYLGTQHIKKWIRDNNYRYAAFLLRESQIRKLARLLNRDGEKALIIISKRKPNLNLPEINLPNSSKEDGLSEAALFRLSIEKERK